MSKNAFVKEVLKSDPVQVLVAVLHNTLDQLQTNSIVMTLPDDKTLDLMHTMTQNIPSILKTTRWTHQVLWLGLVERFHNSVYLSSAVLLGVLLLWPHGGPPWPLRLFVVVCLSGIFANALVCGGISQPAERYGGRVIFFLPLMVAVLGSSVASFKRRKIRV